MNNNADFWTSIESIINDGFTSEGLQKLDRYAEQFISRELVYKRFSPLEQYGCSAGGTTHVIATLLAGAKLMQIQSLRESRISKECSNAERNKLKG